MTTRDGDAPASLAQHKIVGNFGIYLCILACTTGFTFITTYIPEPDQQSGDRVTVRGQFAFPSLIMQKDGITAVVESWTNADPQVDFHIEISNQLPEDVLLDIQKVYVVDQKGRRLSPTDYREVSFVETPPRHRPLTGSRIIPSGSGTGTISVRFDPRQYASNVLSKWWGWNWHIKRATIHFVVVKQMSGQPIPFKATFHRK